MTVLCKGRRAPVYSRRTQRLAVAFHAALSTLGPPPPVSDDYVSAVERQSPGGWICWWNRRLGDCAAEDSGHQVMLHTANAGAIVIPTGQDILKAYEDVGGYRPGDSSTDQGCSEVAMEQYMTTTGICGQKSAATGPLDPANLDHIRWAIQIFGAARGGIFVDEQMENDFLSQRPWESTADPNDPTTTGHDLPFVRYDREYVYGVTWGGLQPIPWALVGQRAFLEEAHLSVYPDFIRAGGTTPAGFNLAQMLADAKAIEAIP